VVGATRQEKTAAEVVPERHRPDQLDAGSAVALGDRQRRRHDRAARMCFRDRLEVVGFVRVSEHAVGQRRIHRRRPDVRRQDGRLRDAALRTDEPDRHLPGEKPRA
jgi:hypothetical protein